MLTKVFTVSEASWEEHLHAQVAAINDPMAEDPGNRRLTNKRQSAISEVAGIRPGDRLFFYVQQSKTILGGFRAATRPYFDQKPLFEGASIINYRFPLRVAFEMETYFHKPLHINYIWESRDEGAIWTMQQARGDAVGRHACWGLSRREGDILETMFRELNVIIPECTPGEQILPTQLDELPINTASGGTVNNPCLRYEHALQSLILEDLGDGYHRDMFGGYSEFLSAVPTSSGREIDLVLLSYDEQSGNYLWYQIVELKKDRFSWEHMMQLLDYEVWLTSNQAGGNPRAVHMVAIANRFDGNVIDFERTRRAAGQKEVRLIEYTYNGEGVLPRVNFEEITL